MRCHITLLACGWLLLSPPLKESTWIQVKAWMGYTSPAEVDAKAPYSKWDLVASFASSEQCQADLSRRLDFVRSTYDAASEKWVQKNNEVTERAYSAALLELQRMSSVVCLPSDAVKLK